MATVRELLRRGAGLPGDSAARDAEILLGYCLGQSRAWLYARPEAAVPEDLQRRYTELLTRRERGEPVAYLTGEREFWSLSLAVTENVLIPRPETEILVEWALSLPLPGLASALDLGTGTGAIALALASERPQWHLEAVDCSEAALAVAADNASRNGLSRVRFARSDWFSALAGRRFDLLVSNPPYVDPADPCLAQGDLRFEPRGALAAGQSGLADLARIAEAAPAHLAPGGWLLLEHGSGQGEAVRALLRAAGFDAVETRRDLAGLERVSGGCLHAE